MPGAPTYDTLLLSPDTWDDFAALVEANGGVWGGCWCMGFHPEGLGGTADDHRAANEQHTRDGTVHRVLVYADDTCVGWCQFGTPAELPNIKNTKAYERELTTLPRWRIGCIFTGSKHRGLRARPADRQVALGHASRRGRGRTAPRVDRLACVLDPRP